METRLLRSFLVLAEELHFGRAARRLGIEQPPLSRQIQSLEADLGVRLFDRTRRRVELTEHGRALRAGVGPLLERMTLLRTELRRLEPGATGTVRIGYVGTAMYALLPALLRALHQRHPRLRAELRELGNDEQVCALRNGELDLGFTRAPVVASGLELRTIAREPYALVVAAAHPRADEPGLALEDLAAEPFLGFARACAPGMVDEIQGICRRAGFTPQQTHSTSQMHSLLRLVESGLGYSIVPASVRHGQQLALRFVELGDIPERTSLAVLREPSSRSESARIVLGLLDELEPDGARPHPVVVPARASGRRGPRGAQARGRSPSTA